jgi:3'-5' exonuclease
MNGSVIIWDIETIPDLQGFAAANYLVGKTDAEIREVMGDKFQKHIYHSIVCIGALVAHRENDKWAIDAIGAPHIGERSEKDLVQAFVDRIAELNPQLVTFNGNSFDLPVLRYRAMVHGVAAPGLSARPYFNRYTDDAIDLCDVLASFTSQAKATLHEICKVMGMSGKPHGIQGGDVGRYCLEGRIKEVADYCETNIVNTYRVWLRYELFRGRLDSSSFAASETNLIEFIRLRSNAKPHLIDLT